MKNVKYNYIAVSIVAAALLIFAALCFVEAYRFGQEGGMFFGETAALIDGGVSDVEGYGAILYFLSGSGAALASVLVLAVGAMALLYSITIFVLASIAKYIYKTPDGRLTAYRVLMGIVYALLAFLAYILISIYPVEHFSAVCIPCLMIVTVILIMGIRNTYTDRIKIIK